MDLECLVQATHEREGHQPQSIANAADVERSTCSACAFESRERPVSRSWSNTWNGYTRATLVVNGTTVMTPRPKRVAVALATSLLDIGRAPIVCLGPPARARSQRSGCPRASRRIESVRHGGLQSAASPDESHSSQAAAYASLSSDVRSMRTACTAADRDSRPDFCVYSSRNAKSLSRQADANLHTVILP